MERRVNFFRFALFSKIFFSEVRAAPAFEWQFEEADEPCVRERAAVY